MASQKSSDLVIKDFQQGIGPSPHVGFGDMRNLDIFSVSGIVKVNNVLAKKSGSTVTGLMKWIVSNPRVPAEKYGVDDGGVVYKSTDSGDTWAVLAGNTAGGIGQGLQIWKDFLWVPRATAMDIYGPLSSSPAWRNSWAGLTMDSDALWHPLLVSKNDGNLYGGAGRYVFSVLEVTGETFTWNNVTTYTATARALDLPPQYRIKCLEELGNNLMIGTWMGTNIYDLQIADIFSWNRTDPSFGAPIQMNEHGVHAMLNIDNLLYVLAGIGGKLFISNGGQAQLMAQIPAYIANLDGGLYLEPFPGAIMRFKGRPFFGISVGGTSSIPGMGIWSLLQTAKGNILNVEHLISTGNDGSSARLKIGALHAVSRDALLAGWQDGASTFGIDKTNTAARVGSYGAYLDSPLYRVGTILTKRQFSEMEFQLAKPMASGDGVKLQYRTNLSAAFADIGTYDYATLGAVNSHNFAPGLPDAELLQIRVLLQGVAELANITLR